MKHVTKETWRGFKCRTTSNEAGANAVAECSCGIQTLVLHNTIVEWLGTAQEHCFDVVFGHIVIPVDGWKGFHDHLLCEMGFSTVQEEPAVLHAVRKPLS